MKRVLLLRHGKSDWDATYVGDHERPLARRGRRGARLVGRWLSELGQVPDAAVTSSAVRARTTVEIAADAGGWPCPVEIEPALYGVSVAGFIDIVRNQPDERRAVLFAGHEPAWSSIAGTLTGGSSVRMVTAAVARIDLPIERWKALEPGAGALAWLVTPKTLSAADL